MLPHIERMEEELKELVEKSQKLYDFYIKELDQPKLTNEKQRTLLAIQHSYMMGYATILRERIENEKMIEVETRSQDCYIGNNYDEVFGTCIDKK